MNLRRLRYFVAVAEELHFTRAAERLGMRQPPLSAQIRELETEIGTPLFLRGTRGIKLTDAGALLLEEARDILKRVERAKVQVQRRARGETGSIVVGFAGATYLARTVPSVMLAFRDRYPDVIVHSQQSNTFALVRAILDGEVDAAFIRPPIADPDPLRIEPIFEEEMVVVLPANHRLHNAEAVALASLAKETFTLPPRSLGPGFYDGIMAAFHKAGFSPSVGQEASTIVALPGMVAAGLGVSVAPKSLTQLSIEGVVYRPIMGVKLRAPIALACRRVNPLPMVRNLFAVARTIPREKAK
jgi:DNA-binding transcriptional LysR family regulator